MGISVEKCQTPEAKGQRTPNDRNSNFDPAIGRLFGAWALAFGV
jgi:hypothetical protein